MAVAQRFLVKMPTPTGDASLAIDGTTVGFTSRPLFKSIGSNGGLIGVSVASTWHIVQSANAFDAGNPWDVCHQMVSQGLGFAEGSGPEFAEPDFQQQWVSESSVDQAFGLTASCVSVPQKTDEGGFPGDPDNFWYQNDLHGQYVTALGSLTLPAEDKLIRAAHLDTGYDKDHQSLPRRLDRQLQRNFVDDDRPNDASDESSGLFNNLGHGTGTLSILAGTPCGGLTKLGVAPFLKVVPIRVANRVELFYNSAIAEAFDYVHQLCSNSSTSVQVVSMSMGGLASQAWAEAVNALYDVGVVVITAAGNNFGNLPTRNIVYPARFNRVIAACGVMANHTPYADLPFKKMAGNYGPHSKMRTAVSAYTPNVPWAKFGCSGIVDYDGAGTSAATPQVAATAAMWLQKNLEMCDAYPSKWMRVEAVRKALFSTASPTAPDQLGSGELRANAALSVAPLPADQLTQEKLDSASFPIFKVLTGLGIQSSTDQQRRMLELEALQLSQSTLIETVLPDPAVDPDSLSMVQRMAIATALAQHPRASRTLRAALQVALAPVVPSPDARRSSIEELHLRHALYPEPPSPGGRRLKVYAYDPSLGRDLETIGLNEAVLSVRWENELAPGPVGEYIEVVDIDPASGCCYAPVDLNDKRLLATDGLRTSEANPQFHQQMVYAVSMKTIEYFEHALGRVALWSTRFADRPNARPSSDDNNAQGHGITERYVQRLRIYPHALRAENAYYSPERKALLLGYFASDSKAGQTASELVFAALSHDIVAHETTHALLDGLHSRFREPTNPDVLAFHEAFADIVALFQHFSLGDSLRDQIAASRGDLTQETLLAKLAVQFGKATGHYGALRDSIGEQVIDKQSGQAVWKRVAPSTGDYQRSTEPHERGSILVAAVFDAFLRIYARRAIVPIRLATNGSEVLPPGALSTQLADALTDVASKLARHVLTICIRALDYCPPIDITFSDFLRALITADHDLVPQDPLGYRVAFVSAFSARGIYPQNVRTLSVETMVWEPPPIPFSNLPALFRTLTLGWDLQSNRFEAWKLARKNAVAVRKWLLNPAMVNDTELSVLGLRREPNRAFELKDSGGSIVSCDMRGIEVHSVRPLRRIGPDGQFLSQLVVEMTQSLHAADGSGQIFRGGATLIIDLTSQVVSYMVRKRFDLGARVSEQQSLWATQLREQGNDYDGLARMHSEPFAALHRNRYPRSEA